MAYGINCSSCGAFLQVIDNTRSKDDKVLNVHYCPFCNREFKQNVDFIRGSMQTVRSDYKILVVRKPNLNRWDNKFEKKENKISESINNSDIILDNIKIVSKQNCSAFNDREGYTKFTFSTSKEFKQILDELSQKYDDDTDPYNIYKSELTDFYVGLEKIAQKYGYSVLNAVGKEYYEFPFSTYLINNYNNIRKSFSQDVTRRTTVRQIIDNNYFLTENSKQNFIRAFSALIETCEYIKTYPGVVKTTDHYKIVNNLLYVIRNTYMTKGYDAPIETVVNNVLALSQNIRPNYFFDTNYRTEIENISKYIKNKTQNIIKDYLLNIKALAKVLNTIDIENMDSNEIVIATDAKLDTEQANIAVNAIAKYL